MVFIHHRIAKTSLLCSEVGFVVFSRIQHVEALQMVRNGQRLFERPSHFSGYFLGRTIAVSNFAFVLSFPQYVPRNPRKQHLRQHPRFLSRHFPCGDLVLGQSNPSRLHHSTSPAVLGFSVALAIESSAKQGNAVQLDSHRRVESVHSAKLAVSLHHAADFRSVRSVLCANAACDARAMRSVAAVRSD